MKKIFKNPIFTFILGAIIFGSIGTVIALTYKASNITYNPKNSEWNVSTVEDAINDLNIKVKPEYTGSTSVTPTTSSQTLYTNNKILKNNIIIESIPSTYKILATSTTVEPSSLLNGITAYDNNGNLITGTLNTNCQSGSVLWNQDKVNNGYTLLNYKPTVLYVWSPRTDGTDQMFRYIAAKNANEIKIWDTKPDNSAVSSSSLTETNVKINSNNVTLTFWDGRLNQTIYYAACR